MNCMQFYDVISDFISRVKEDPDRFSILNCPNTQQVTVQRPGYVFIELAAYFLIRSHYFNLILPF